MSYWVATSKGGKKITENEAKWFDIKDQITDLSLFLNDGTRLALPKNMEGYIQAKTASANLDGSNVQIESRYIGFKLGNNTVRVRIDEKSNNISMEVE